MGLGDFLHWTAIVRDLYNDINTGEFIDRINKIKRYIENYNNKKKVYGVYKYKHTNDIDNFKIVLVCSKFKSTMYKLLFFNNPYIISCQITECKNIEYPNIIYLNIVSSHYYINKKFLDKKHVIATYSQTMGIPNYLIKPDIHFTEREIIKVKKFLPKDNFIYIEPTNHKPGRSYPFEKFQSIVNKYKDVIEFVQISPSKFADKASNVLDNVTSFIDKFTFRETLYYISFAKLVIVNHGGLSIGAAVTNTKTIAIYTAWFDPVMTKFKNEISISIATTDHNRCNSFYNKPCKICLNLFLKHDVNIITKYIDELF